MKSRIYLNGQRHLWFLVGFFVLFFLFLWDLVFLKSSFVLGDYATQHLPWAWITASHLKEGSYPYWTHLMTSGFPLLAEGQSASLYLINLLTYKFLPFNIAYTWSVPLHMGIGAFGFYRYALRLRLSPRAAALASLVFSFSSGYGGAFYNMGSLKTFCWMPWILWLLEMNRSQPRMFRLGVMAVLFSQQWTAGFPQMALYSMGYVLLHEIWANLETNPRTHWRLHLGSLFCTMIAGFFLALPQLWPTWELTAQ